MRLISEPHFLLVNQFVVFASEARKTNAIAITPLGYDFVNLKFRS